MTKLSLFAALSCVLASVAALPAPGSGGVTVGQRIALLPRAEEAEDPNKIDQTAQFNTKVALKGGNIQQDTTFPPGQNGVLEIEFSNIDGRTLTVVENKKPPPPPAGFTAIEKSTFQVTLSGGSADNLTVSKVDYIQNADSPLDISTGQIGRLCTKTNTFIIGADVGELEFEADEKELSLKVANMNGEFGIFLPNAAAAAAGGAAAGAGAGTAAGGTAIVGNASLLQLLASLLSKAGITLTAGGI
ncbi:hypothetical protein QBC33DRAFT_591938 [Phialemonium atrogriseum]|uniref:Accumulation-associated protein n=1 Tax=Phialemonium atrogriseum TaxID=1093897 RepID=A0AAJ0C7R5_9PEZI|nr:uncharacterized protein QBC33DRAFT_591938 [Phialemonium atrogriseum]KAK1771526.1 hypothetical protein QBC33DRAFT_591938 [Phialemonium atrogriseum]